MGLNEGNRIGLNEEKPKSKVKDLIEKVLGIFKLKTNSLLCEENTIIYSNTDKLLRNLMTQGEISKDDTKLSELLMHYIEKGYISRNNIMDSLNTFLIREVNYIYLKTRKPITGTGGLSYEGKIVKETHDIWHDLTKYEQKILAYGIENNFLDEQQINKLNINTNDTYYNLEKFCEEYYDENLLDKYIAKLGLNI